MKQHLRLAAAVAAAVSCAAIPAATHAQYPEKPIRFIVPFAPGGSTDFLARLVGQKMTESMKQQILVDNRGGAGGTLGADLAAKAPADGYTIVLTAISHSTAVGFYKKLPYDLVTDLQAVSLFATQPNALVIHPSLPAKSVKEFVALARSKPGQLAYSSTGNGSAQHLMGELFKALTKTDMIHVAYKGTAPALADLMAGNVQASMQPVINSVPNAKAGRIRMLAVTGPKRSHVAPDVPTMMEAGVPQYNVVAWYGVHAPSKTPRPIIDILNKEIVRAVNLPDVRERIQSQGLDPSPNTPDQFQAFVKSEVARWSKVIADAGIKPD
ncbi:MAG TPA: tripartite tricarboxylate transporter substrate binding protein [Burkholderiales bacterium]|nr:tripartite tricarboxylate transporter substrate binding protein [Burkholderiales bacterium]